MDSTNIDFPEFQKYFSEEQTKAYKTLTECMRQSSELIEKYSKEPDQILRKEILKKMSEIGKTQLIAIQKLE